MILTTWKHHGETMSEVLKRALEAQNLNEPATYAGRLDVAASGIVVLLTGADRYNKPDYLTCRKQYRFVVVLGVATDTGDIFGILKSQPNHLRVLLPDHFETSIRTLIGTRTVPLPAYSGFRHEGKPLWSHALQGDTPAVLKPVTIHSFDSIALIPLHTDTLLQSVTSLATNPALSGYRQNEILSSWREKLYSTELQALDITVTVSAGTYIRTLAEDIGALFSMQTLAYDITRIGIELPNATWVRFDDGLSIDNDVFSHRTQL